MGWVKAPRVVTRPFHKHGRGRGRKTPRAGQRQPPPRRVDAMLEGDGVRNQPWVNVAGQGRAEGADGLGGQAPAVLSRRTDGLPGEPLHLIVARDVLDPAELKFFVSNAPAGDARSERCCSSRSRGGGWSAVSRTRSARSGWTSTRAGVTRGSKRHLILSCVSYLFLSRVRQEFGGKNPELTECQVHTAVAALVCSWWLSGRGCSGCSNKSGGDPVYPASPVQARKSHTKTTRRKLRALGIRLTDLPRCRWDTT